MDHTQDRTQVRPQDRAHDEADRVAVVGMAGRFPGAPDVAGFWRNLVEGREAVTALGDDELLAAGVAPELLRRENYVKAKGVLEDADCFDAAFFGYSPREAELMDPQHRVLLECAWDALADAGCDPARFAGRIGVFAGASLNSYLLFNVMADDRAREPGALYQTLLTGDKDFLATRVSYKLGLTGPGITVQTACSTSLTAVHLACQSLLNGECDIALAGGVSVTVPLRGGYLHERGGILSPDGHCRAFDAEAGGTVPGNGAGVVVLRRLADARAAGDTVTAVIRGTAVNNDGSLKAGYTAPSVDGQAEVVAEALAVAEVDAASVGYVETHGTGTALGDPIEIAALTRAFREHTDERGYCAIGSAKTGVGHLDAAAGVTSLIKAALALRHGVIPPSLHFTRPNPELRLADSPFFVNDAVRPWPRRDGAPRRAGVSSFGVGGTNVHVVLEEAPPAAPGGPSRPVQVLPLSGRTAPALAENARRLADHLERHPDAALPDVAHTLTRRAALECRAAVVARNTAEAAAALRSLNPGDAAAAGDGAPVAFLFPGQGAQYPGMGRGLYEAEPGYAAAVDRCAELFAGHLGEDLRDLLFPGPAAREEAAARLARTEFAQPALFTTGYALAGLWSSWGVRPRAMAGHSVGELVAACLAGVFSLEDAVRLVAARGRLVQAMPPGAMLSVFLPAAETERWLTGGLSLAAVNSTSLSVVGGPAGAVADLRDRLAAAGVPCRELHTSHAFHSPDMDGAVAPFTEEVRQVPLAPPRIPFLSNVTGTWITDEQATSAEYWGAHLRGTVRFADALGALLADPGLVLLEAGPGRTLADFARRHSAWRDGRTAVASLPHPKERGDDPAHALRGLGALWSAGVPVDWPGFLAGEDRRVLSLPGYAFQRRRYWIDAPGAGRAHADRTPAGRDGERAGERAGERPEAAAPGIRFHTPGWRRLPPRRGSATAPGARWLLLGADTALGRDLAGRLAGQGARVVTAVPGDELRRTGDGDWVLDPARREHHASLLASLADDPEPLRIAHLWSLAAPPPAEGPAARLDTARLDTASRLGLTSLTALAQALAGTRPKGPVHIDVLCRGVYAVTGEEPLQPEHATLLGPCTVIPQEIPGTTCRVLDVTGAGPHHGGPAGAAVHALLTRATEERELALRGRHWWVRDYDPLPPQDAAPDGGPPLRDGGVYLITGGLGGVGLALAEEIADAAKAPVLALLGRSPFPAEEEWDDRSAAHGEGDPVGARIRRLRRLAERGARPEVLRADVTDPEAMAAVVAGLRARHGALHGVIHAAGLPSAGMLATRPQEAADEVLAAKTRGTLVLDQVCGDDLDFLILCSSLTAVLGGPGQSDYAAANAFLDAFAQWRARDGAPVTSVAWDTWRDVGMAAGLRARLGGADETEPLPAGRLLPLHPVRAADGSRTWRTPLTTAHWVVDDHRIGGHGLVPGTAYLELVRAAVAEEAAGRVVQLGDVLFLTPLVVPDGGSREIFTTVETRDGATRFTVRSRAAGEAGTVWREHAVGTVAFLDRDGERVRDLAGLLPDREVTRVLDTPEEIGRALGLDRFGAGGELEFGFGPRWRCLRAIRAGERHLLATLALDDAHLADIDGDGLHPALLDVAGGCARVYAPDVHYLPLTYRSLRVRHGLTGTVLVHAVLKEPADSSGETLTCDMEIMDPDGRTLVEVTDFSVKRINDLAALRRQVEREAAAEDGAEPGEGVLRELGEGMAEQDARAAFRRLPAASPRPEHVVVTSRDLGRLRRLALSLTPGLLAREAERTAPPRTTHPRPDLDTPYVEPATELQRAVAAIWREALGVDRVGADDDFFALGGHSLAAVQIGTRIHSGLGVELDLRAFFDAPTVAGTAALLEAAAPGGPPGGDAGGAIEALAREETGDGAGAPDPGGPDPDLDGLSDEEVDAQLRELLAAGTGEEGDTA
ncbi:type I polyketide synthase [Streptomyces capparidis]